MDIQDLVLKIVQDTPTSRFAHVLNELDAMQQSEVYAARWPVLAKAECLIVSLEQERDQLQAKVDEVMSNTRMTAQQLIESQKGERWLRVLLVDTDGKPVPVQYDTEGRLKMDLPECLSLQQERDQLKEAAQQASTALQDIIDDDMSDIRKSLVQESFYAIAALAKVGVHP